jgi:CspA family cold shock protein
MLLRIQLGGVEAPRFNSKVADEYALEIVRGLRSEETCMANCEKAVETITRELLKFAFPSAEDPSRLKAFTVHLMEAVKAPVPQQETIEIDPLLGSVENGAILWYDDERGFGFIERDAGGDIFVHRSGMLAVPWHLREPGTRVTYKVAQGPTTLKADKVRPEGMEGSIRKGVVVAPKSLRPSRA